MEDGVYCASIPLLPGCKGYGETQIKALDELRALKNQNTYDYNINYYLGDTYEKMKKNDDARNLYESLIDANEKNLWRLSRWGIGRLSHWVIE